MDAEKNSLEIARELLIRADDLFDRAEAANSTTSCDRLHSQSKQARAAAAIYAAVAQAEALTRLAEVAETLLEAGALDHVQAQLGTIAGILDLLTDKSTDRAWLRIDVGAA